MVYKDGNVCFIDFPSGDTKNNLGKFILGCYKFITVQKQKDQGRDRPDSLIPIDKWMILDQMEKIGSSHFINIRMQELAAESC